MMAVAPIPADLAAWLEMHAEALDASHELADEVVPRLGRAGLFCIGVPTSDDGAGGTIVDAIEAIAGVASYSLTAGLVFWGQRSFIEYRVICAAKASRPAARARHRSCRSSRRVSSS